MPTLKATTFFKDVPPNSFFEVWVEKNDAGALECDFTFSNLDPTIPDQRWDNAILLRTNVNPGAKGRAPIIGPVGCFLFAIAVVNVDGTKGRVVLRVVDAQGKELRSTTWLLAKGKGKPPADPLEKGDDFNGIHAIYLA